MRVFLFKVCSVNISSRAKKILFALGFYDKETESFDIPIGSIILAFITIAVVVFKTFG